MHNSKLLYIVTATVYTTASYYTKSLQQWDQQQVTIQSHCNSVHSSKFLYKVTPTVWTAPSYYKKSLQQCAQQQVTIQSHCNSVHNSKLLHKHIELCTIRKQGWEFAHSLIAHSLIAHLLICSFRSNQMNNCEWFAQITQDKWVTVSKSLRSLRGNE